MKLRTTALSLALLALPAAAQTFEVPGDYADLQQALDAVPPDATVVVHGGHWFGLNITKPVSIVGDPQPHIWGDGPFVPPITLGGPGSGTVVLENLDVGVQINAGGFALNTPGITGHGFDRLVVRDSFVTGPVWVFVYNYVFPGGTGIDVDLPLVWVERSQVRGSDTDAATNSPHSDASNPSPLGAPGGSGIVTTGNVVLFESTVVAGDGDPWISYASPDCSYVCPGGDGGNGIECQVLVNIASTVEAGEPSVWSNEAGIDACCAGSPGERVIAEQEWLLQPEAWPGVRAALQFLK